LVLNYKSKSIYRSHNILPQNLLVILAAKLSLQDHQVPLTQLESAVARNPSCKSIATHIAHLVVVQIVKKSATIELKILLQLLKLTVCFGIGEKKLKQILHPFPLKHQFVKMSLVRMAIIRFFATFVK
jgi:hypothetical protein